MFLCVIVSALLAAFPITVQSQQASKKTCDLKKILWPLNDQCTLDEDCLLTTVVDAGEAALPILIRAVQDNTGECADDRYETSLFLISLIGGIKSVDTLREQYNRHPQSMTERALCFAMASTGRNEDIEFLVRSLTTPDPEYDRWAAIEAAAISLGILRYKDAIPLMKQLLHEDPSGLLGDSLNRSIDWLQHHHPDNGSFEKPNEGNQSIHQAILSCCPLKRQSDNKEYSDTFISADGKRALVEVMLHNHKYIYLLRKNNNWEVTGMARVAIYD